MDTKMEDSGGTAPTLTAQQMLEKFIVPVKAEFLVRKAPPIKQEDKVTTSETANRPSTEPEAAGGLGVTGGPHQKQDQEQSRNKSRKQMRKDVRNNRQAELCTNYALGRCTYGERCKFSHDLEEYVRSKPADLPGTCPWTAVQATCPYGITCRYARTHGSDDELHRTLNTVLEAAAAAGATPNGAAAATLAETAGDANGGGAATTPTTPLVETSAPAGPCALPLPTSIEKETNFLSKDVQAQLWKNRYDFTRADGILKSMDLRISFKHQPKPLPGGGGGGGGRGGGRGGRGGGQGGGRRGADDGPEPLQNQESSGQQQQQQQQGEGEVAPTAVVEPVAAAAEEAAEAEATEGAEAATGMQVDGAAAAVGTGTGGAADGAATTTTAATITTTAGAAAAAAVETTTVPQDGEDEPSSGPAAKRQRTDGSDAAAVAALAAEPPPQQPGAANDTSGGGPTGRLSAEAVAEARAQHVEVPVRAAEKRRVDFQGKTYLAPLTTVGNLPFRRVCKRLGVDVTCGEMALATNLLQGQASEWALMKRHPCEDCFGVQVCGGYPDALARVGQLLGEQLEVDFVDINMGCPIDLVCDKNAGSALLRQPRRIEQILRATSAALGETPLTFKTRKGYNDGEDVAHTFLHKAGEWGAAAVTLHGRTRQQRYSKLADWDYIQRCGKSCGAAGLQLIGNGDVFSYLDWNQQMQEEAGGHLASLMIGRGALIKPWIFTEIKEQRHWDISASERLDLYRQFCSAGLEHWGSDGRGVETTRRFLLEWLSFTCRYVPVGLLEVLPQQMNHRPPNFVGRSDLETLLASDSPQDWVRISEMLLGPAPAAINFTAKHKSNSYAAGATSELDMARG